MNNIVRNELKRLSLFGNLETEAEFQEYEKTLSCFSEQTLHNGITLLVANHSRRGFPYPADIITAIKTATSDRPKEHHYADPECGSMDMNVAFWKCFRMAGELKKERRIYYLQRMAGVSVLAEQGKPDSMAITFFTEIIGEIEKEICDITPRAIGAGKEK